MSSKQPVTYPPRVQQALHAWQLALAETSRKKRMRALRDLVLRQAAELDRLDTEIKELEAAWEAEIQEATSP